MSKWEQFDALAAKQRAEWDKVPEDDEPPVPVRVRETYDTSRARTVFIAWLKEQGVDWRHASRFLDKACRSAHLDGKIHSRERFKEYARWLRESTTIRDTYIAGKLFEIIRGQEDEDDLR